MSVIISMSLKMPRIVLGYTMTKSARLISIHKRLNPLMTSKLVTGENHVTYVLEIRYAHQIATQLALLLTMRLKIFKEAIAYSAFAYVSVKNV